LPEAVADPDAGPTRSARAALRPAAAGDARARRGGVGGRRRGPGPVGRVVARVGLGGYRSGRRPGGVQGAGASGGGGLGPLPGGLALNREGGHPQGGGPAPYVGDGPAPVPGLPAPDIQLPAPTALVPLNSPYPESWRDRCDLRHPNWYGLL